MDFGFRLHRDVHHHVNLDEHRNRKELFLEVKSQKEDINLVLVLCYQPVSLYTEVNFISSFNLYVAKKASFNLNG